MYFAIVISITFFRYVHKLPQFNLIFIQKVKSINILSEYLASRFIAPMSATTYANKNATCVSMTATSGDYKVSLGNALEKIRSYNDIMIKKN